MALTRRSVQRVSGTIWPGFVDAMTALLLVLMFVLTIFMIVQFMLRETITGQETELDKLTAEVTALAQALGLEQQRAFQLENQVGALNASLNSARDEAATQAALIANLTLQTEQQAELLASQAAQITSFEAQVATLLTQRDEARSQGAALSASLADLQEAQELLLSEKEQLQLALAAARDEIDAAAEEARLAAARREALDAMIADLQAEAATREATLADTLAALQDSEKEAEDTRLSLAEALRLLGESQDESATRADQLAALQERLATVETALSAEEEARLAEAVAAEALRKQLAQMEGALSEEEATRLAEAAAAKRLREELANAQDELTAMTLALEEQRRQAEETLTLLAAAELAQADINDRLAEAVLARDRLSQELDASEQEGSKTALELDRLEAALAAALLARDDLSAKYSDEAGKRGDAEARLANIEEQLARMTAERDSLRETLATSGDEVLTLSERLANAEAALAAAKADAESLRANLGDDETLRDQLARALAAQIAAEQDQSRLMSEREQRDILLAAANKRLAEEEAVSADSQRKIALLNEQVAAMRAQLGSLQVLLDTAAERDRESQVEITNLGSQLNVALAQLASEERKRAALEEAERIRLEEEAKRLAAEAAALKDETVQLEKYRSEFFGQMRELLAGREGVQIVGDRFVFSSEVLFEPASATLAASGREQIEHVAEILNEVSRDIPPSIDWIIRVDGHTDATPLSGTGQYRDNWELSQARALSVVRFMTDQLGFPPSRLAATGFGEFRPVVEGDSPEAYAQNRRIELKLTER